MGFYFGFSYCTSKKSWIFSIYKILNITVKKQQTFNIIVLIFILPCTNYYQFSSYKLNITKLLWFFYIIFWNLEFEVNCYLQPEFEVVWIDTAKANSI